MDLLRHHPAMDTTPLDDVTLETVLIDTSVSWSGYPQMRHPVAYRQNLMIRERCRLTVFTIEVNKLLLSPSSDRLILESGVHELGASMRAWYETLPKDLCLEKNSPSSLYDFQCVSISATYPPLTIFVPTC